MAMCCVKETVFLLILLIVLSFTTKPCNASNTTYSQLSETNENKLEGSNYSLISRTNEKMSTETSNKVFALKQIDYNIWKFVPPVLYVVGTVGNMLTIAVLRR